MATGWFVLGVIGVVLVFALARIVSKIAHEREVAKRRKQAAAMKPIAEDTVTYAGHS